MSTSFYIFRSVGYVEGTALPEIRSRTWLRRINLHAGLDFSQGMPVNVLKLIIYVVD